jgi:hypothetical protein
LLIFAHHILSSGLLVAAGDSLGGDADGVGCLLSVDPFE